MESNNAVLTLSSAAVPEEMVSNVDDISNEAHSSSANAEPLEVNDDLTLSSAATPEETFSSVSGPLNDAQSSGVNTESEISPMEVSDEPTSCAVGSDKSQVSVVEGPSNEVCSSLSFATTSEPVSTAVDSSSEAHSSSVTRETEIAPMKDIDHLTLSSETAKSQTVSAVEDLSSDEGTSSESDSVTMTSADTTMEDSDDSKLSSETATSQTISTEEDASSNDRTSSDSVTTTSADIPMEDSDDLPLSYVSKSIAANNQTTSVLNRKNKTPLSVSKDFKQPPMKKIKLSKSIKVPVKDDLNGVHTSLCGRDCNIRHNPLELAVSAPNDFKLKTCLENHLKLAVSRNWESARNIQHLYHPLVHIVLLFGKCDLLEFLLKGRLGNAKLYVDSARPSPLQTLLMQIHHYMPTSSLDEKVTTFQQMLHLLVQYDYNILLVRDVSTDDSILHTCTKKIRDLSKQIKAAESLEESLQKLQKLLKERTLLEQLFKEMMQAFQRLGREGPRIRYQVMKLILSSNKAGMIIFKILEAEEFIRQSCSDASNQTTSISLKERKRVFVMQQIRAEDEDNVTAENAPKSTIPSTSSCNCAGVHSPKGCVLACFAHTKLSSHRVNRSGTVALSPNCLSVQVSDGCPNPSASMTAAASACASVPTVVPSLAVNPSRATALSPNCLSVRASDGCPNPSASMTAAASVCVSVQTVPPSLAVNPLRAKALSHIIINCLSGKASQRSINKCTSTSVPVASSSPQTKLSTQDGCLNQSTSTTVAASACATVQTVLSSLAVNPSRATAVPRNCLSVRAPDECPNQSTSTTATTSACVSVQTNPLSVRAPQRSVKKFSSTAVSVSSCSTQTELSAKTVFASGSMEEEVHTCICEPHCHVKHHKLTQLLCATPDHHSTDTLEKENESLSNFKNYLIETAWPVEDVVPDPMPIMCFSIVHLACLLGKHKALEVLMSEFAFDPLIRTAITEETPLHMTLKLVQYQSNDRIFLSDVVVSIVKTLSCCMHASLLLSAKDYEGNTVLHTMAELIGSVPMISLTILLVYFFRVLVYFQLNGLSVSAACQNLSNSLTDCNSAGQTVEHLLQSSVQGRELLEYLEYARDSLMKEVTVRYVGDVSPASHCDTSSLSQGQAATNGEEAALSEKEEIKIKTEVDEQCTSSCLQNPSANNSLLATVQNQECDEPTTQVDARLINVAEPESLVDFILSSECGINNLAKKRIVQSYLAEYTTRLAVLKAEMESLKKTPEVLELEKEAEMLKSAIAFKTRKMLSLIEERNKQRYLRFFVDQRIKLIDDLTDALE